MKVARSISLLAAILLAPACRAQTLQAPCYPPPPPATKLEAFSARTGTVIVRGISKIGVLSGAGSVTIEARQLKDSSVNSPWVSGLSITVKDPAKPERDSVALVDYDEIDSLLQSIDYLSKLSQDATAMQSSEAEYRTKGDFSVVAFSTHRGALRIAVSAGRFPVITAYVNPSDLAQLKALVQSAKSTLDAATSKASL